MVQISFRGILQGTTAVKEYETSIETPRVSHGLCGPYVGLGGGIAGGILGLYGLGAGLNCYQY